MPIIQSILDNDLYKYTMGQAVNQKFPNAWAKYKFINRGGTRFSEKEFKGIKDAINLMGFLYLERDELLWLKEACPYFSPVYLDFLYRYRYDSREVTLNFNDGQIEIEIEGPWYRTIYWEVPIMAIVSEVYNRNSKQPERVDLENALIKAIRLSESKCKFADFGTRRRFSSLHHSNVAHEFTKWKSPDGFIGTSNMHMAHKYGVKPIGTVAHEWIMFHGAQYGYVPANLKAMQNWIDIYDDQLGIALTDTYSSDSFFNSFSNMGYLYDGIRHDSGDPYKFAEKAIQFYRDHGCVPNTKTIVFSDGLDVDKAIALNNAFSQDINCSFGIGTNLTNDIENGTSPLNMVIKMTECKMHRDDEWTPAIKLSDVEGKHTGDPEEIERCKKALGIK